MKCSGVAFDVLLDTSQCPLTLILEDKLVVCDRLIDLVALYMKYIFKHSISISPACTCMCRV